MAGTFSSNQQVELEGVVFLEFFQTWRLDNIEARIFNSDCHYNMIIGQDILNALGISMDFTKKEITCDTIPTRNGRELGEIRVSKVGTNF